jgi:hypothetical protein
MRKFLVIIFLLPCCALFACGSEEESRDGESTVAASADRAPRSWPRLENAAKPYAERLIVPTGPPPRSVVIRDLKKGTGARLRPRYWFTISYLAMEYPSREVLEDKRGAESWYWVWGNDGLTKGWEIGLKGLREGGVRELIVPSRLAYGTGTIVYVLKLLRVTRTQLSTEQLRQ